MSKMKKYLILFLLTGTMACASVKIVHDYDREVDFSQYKTYSLTQDDLNTVVSEFNRERILNAMETELASKGLTKSEDADLLVNAHIKSKEGVEAVATTSGGYGAYGWHRGNSSTYVNYEEYTVGSLFITLADAATETIIWQGAGTKTIEEGDSAKKREKTINYAVKQILMNYPPAK
jgi:hypothetical protein